MTADRNSLHLALTGTGLPRIGWSLWLLALLLLPLTTLALIPLATPVRPPTPVLAGLALAVLLACRFMDWRNFLAMSQVRVLGLFCAWAVVASLIGLGLGDHPLFKGYTGSGAVLKALLSLAMGVVVYLAAQVALMDGELRRRSEHWLIAGMALTVMVALMQAAAGLGVGWARAASLWLAEHVTVHYDSAGGYLEQSRTWGLSLEPSFMASALGVALLPLACTRAILFGSRAGWLGTSLAYIGIGLTTSRGGLLYVVVLTTLTWLWLASPFARLVPGRRRIGAALALAALCLICLSISSRTSVNKQSSGGPTTSASPAGTVSVASDNPPAWTESMIRYGFLYRALCATSAWQVFQEHPIRGTGLGLSSWELPGHYPSWALTHANLDEARADLDQNNPRLPNAKNLPLRLLAELGLIGMAFYLWFIWLHRPIWDYKRPMASLLPLLALGAIVVDWLTLDSFALVGPWIALAWAAHAREPTPGPAVLPP